MPRQAYDQSIAPIKFPKPLCVNRVSTKISRTVGAKVRRAGSKQSRQTAARQMGSDLCAFGGVCLSDYDLRKGAREERYQARIALEHAMVSCGDHILNKAGEEDLIAYALLTPEQQLTRLETLA